jgi:hypothetical protein
MVLANKASRHPKGLIAVIPDGKRSFQSPDMKVTTSSTHQKVGNSLVDQNAQTDMSAA